MSGIFISYRRADASGWAGRLRDTLSERFGNSHVFMDIETIRPGVDFAKAIDDAVSSSDVLLALIGPSWLNAQDNQGRRRLDDPDDFTRLEIATALRSQRVVIPVLLGGASMPARADLPEDLQGLARLQASEVSDKRWDYDVTQLLGVLEPLLRSGKHRRRPLLLAAAVGVTVIAVGLGLWLGGAFDGSTVVNPAGRGNQMVAAAPSASTSASASSAPSTATTKPAPAKPAPSPTKPFPEFDDSLARADAMAKEAQKWMREANDAATRATASAERAAAAASSFATQLPQHGTLAVARNVATAAGEAARLTRKAADEATQASQATLAQRQAVAASRDLATARTALETAEQLTGSAKNSAGDAIRYALGADGRADDVQKRLDTALAENANDCRDGLVWRQARPGDKVCVTTETYRAVLAQNRTASQRWTNGPYGPQTCISGYVWREAFEGDTVCVKPEIRTQTKQDNRLVAQRRR